MTRGKAIALAHRAGFGTLIGLGASGDHGYGSRLYFGRDSTAKPWPTERAEVSKVGAEWAVSFFPDGPLSVFNAGTAR